MLNLIFGILLALGLVATLYLFVALKKELQLSQRSQRRDLDEAIRAILDRLEEAEQRTSNAIERTAAAPTWVPASAGMNLSKRVHALRLWKRGELPSHIAAAVAVPEKEVELLIRVQEAVARAG